MLGLPIRVVNGYVILAEDLVDVVDGVEHRVPKGYRSDGASIPRIFAWLFPRWNEVRLKAALFHDYDYEYGLVSQKHADRLFYARMLVHGNHGIRSWLMYRALRFFGHIAWKRAAKARESLPSA